MVSVAIGITRSSAVDPDHIPVELRSRRQWVLWRLEVRDGKPTKIPYRASAPTMWASSTDPATWDGFEQATAASHTADGIGFVFSDDDPTSSCPRPGGASTTT